MINELPHGEVIISESKPVETAPGRISRMLGGASTFEIKHLHEYCYKEPSHLSHDLAALLGAVRLADRSFTRHHSKGWKRQLRIELPVYELETWRGDKVTSSLVECLQYLTADTWEFRFTKRRKKPRDQVQQHVVGAPDSDRVFVPFSHGLDSFAQCELLRSRYSVEIVPVNINASRNSRTWRSLSKGRPPGAVPVSSQVDEPHHTEPSFRTRPFIYDLMAAYGAAMSNATRVLVPENGQGSLGGSLVPLGPEAPHRSCHPGFTTLLATFVHALTGHSVSFVHPALFQTKGEVLAELLKVKPDSTAWLSAHTSCSYDSRHAHTGGRQVHCGVCGNCILRRVSAKAAGIADPTEYRVDRTAPSIHEGLGGKKIRELRAYQDVAYNSSRSMQRLADLADKREDARVWGEADSIGRALKQPPESVKVEMERLLGRHKVEWMEFLNDCGADSWPTQFARQ
jgi:hypothetical protein